MDHDSVRRTEDIARRTAVELSDQLAGMHRQQMDSLEKLISERFGQIHRDLQELHKKMEDLALRVQALDKQSALNGAALALLKEKVDGLSHDIHGSGGIVPRVRELEKSQSANAPVIAGVGKVVMAIVLAVVAAAMGFLLRGQTP